MEKIELGTVLGIPKGFEDYLEQHRLVYCGILHGEPGAPDTLSPEIWERIKDAKGNRQVWMTFLGEYSSNGNNPAMIFAPRDMFSDQES